MSSTEILSFLMQKIADRLTTWHLARLRSIWALPNTQITSINTLFIVNDCWRRANWLNREVADQQLPKSSD